MVQSPLCVSPPSVLATPNTIPAIARMRTMDRCCFMGCHPSPSSSRRSENIGVLERHEFVQRQVLKSVLARFFNELRRDSLHLRADDFFALQILEASCLQSLHVLRRDSLHLHPDQLMEIWPNPPHFANVFRGYPLHAHSHEFFDRRLQSQAENFFHISRCDTLNLHRNELIHVQVLEPCRLHPLQVGFFFLPAACRLRLLGFVRLLLRCSLLGLSRRFCALRLVFLR